MIALVSVWGLPPTHVGRKGGVGPLVVVVVMMLVVVGR